MPLISSTFVATTDISTLTLARYAQLIRYDENAFFGVNAPTNRERACRKIWTKLERDMLSRNLGEATALIEPVLRFPLGQKWFVDEMHCNTSRFFTRWSHVQSLGTRAVSDIALAVPLDHTNDPAVIAATVTVVTVEEEIHFYQPGTDVEVYPDTLILAGGTVSASFPRARLVKEADQDNPDTGLTYADTSAGGPFVQAVDIKRVYTDSADVGEFVFPLGEDCLPDCTEDTEPACGYIRSNESGVVSLLPSATGNCVWRGASEIRINYCAGLPLSLTAENAIIHLAHALMAVMPCEGCDPIMMLWKQDRSIPEQITNERANGLFGVSEGAWRAWIYATKNRHYRISII